MVGQNLTNLVNLVGSFVSILVILGKNDLFDHGQKLTKKTNLIGSFVSLFDFLGKIDLGQF